MSTINIWTEQRLALLENGYSPIKNRDKRTFLQGWPSLELTPELIRSWDRSTRDKATGLRIEDGLAAIDFDINDKEAMDTIADRVFEAVPELGDVNANLLIRHGKGAKEAWFVRTAEDFGRIHSRAYTRPGESVDDGTHRVEIFGGASPRQFGALGPHTVADDGSVEVEYRYADRSPLDTRKSELPELTKQQFFQIADIVEAVLVELGWQLVERSSKGENDAVRVYDLTEEMQFDILGGGTLSLQELREAVGHSDEGVRCSASWLEGPQAINRSRCLVTVTRTGNLAIWESAAGVTHCEASLKPKDYSVAINRIAEMERENKERRRNSFKDGDDAIRAAGKLLATYGYCPYQMQDAVPLWSSSMDDGIPLAKLRIQLLPYCSEEIGPKGGIKRINPVDLWTSDSQRVMVRGLRMRPDKERPTYEEGGETFVNIYKPPRHEAEGGNVTGGMMLMEQLFPAPEQRHWFMCWLAHKVRYPHIPGPGVVHVARAFGTGRGTLAELMKSLMGPRYVRQLAFSLFAGKTYQAQYNEWQAEALMVIVNESSESDGSSTFQTKRNTYEHLKELVDPSPVEREIIVKSRQNYRALSFTSFFIATNHEDALPIPADDRRFAVLSSGEPRDEEFWQDIRDWMAVEANVAAFYRHLMTMDIGDYSPFAMPLRTDAKYAMIEAGQSDLDKAVSEAIAAMHNDVMVMDQLVPMVERVAKQEGYELPNLPNDKRAALIRRVAAKVLYKVGERGGVSERLMIGAVRHYVWARTPTARKRYSTMEHAALRMDVLRNGDVGSSHVGSAGHVGSKLAILRQPTPK